MPDAAYQKYSKALKIVPGGKAIEDLNIAIIAGGSSKMKDPQGLFKTATFKTHFVKLLIAKSNQNQCSYRQKVHPDKEEAYCLLYFNPGICIPDQGE